MCLLIQGYGGIKHAIRGLGHTGLLMSIHFAGLGGHVHGLKVPSTRNCELAAVSMKAKDLVKQALGGKRECADAELQEACCSQVIVLEAY